ncbi:histidine kinase [Streptomyces sp. NPDC060322]|uniref:histidine kinase n=1 Tax=Streptomyces sp. NPDC060322 TaxID=3347097 RepID=UPI00364F155F
MTAWAVAVVAAAELLRVRREQWAAARAERAAAERRRADEERLRMVRELHDVLAHSISVINVRAGVGPALLDVDPEQARTALTTIKSAGKEALGEVRQVLENLRTPGDAPPAPAPGLDRLPEREREVMALVGIGLTHEEIARRLVVSPLTAKTHVSRAMVKLGARDRDRLVVLAYESGLVRPGWLG